MSSFLLNRGRVFYWRRRIPLRFAVALMRTHIVLCLGTGDPKRARQLSRRLAVHFDDIFEIMSQATKQLTPDDFPQIIQSFKDLVQERLDLFELIAARETEQEREERLATAPTVAEFDAIVADEARYLAENPDAQAAYDERVAAHFKVAELGNVTTLATDWQAALRTNKTNIITPLLDQALTLNGFAAHVNSINALKLRRQVLEAGLDLLAQRTEADTPSIEARPTAAIRAKPSPKLSELAELFLADKSESHDNHQGYVDQTERQTRVTFRLWQELNDDRPIREYTREHAWRFYDTIRRVPTHHGKSQHDERSILEQVEWADTQPNNVPRLKMKTAKRHFSALNQLWKWSRVRGHVDEIITTGFEFPGTRSNNQQRSAWPNGLILKLFQSSWWGVKADRTSARYWAALISLHCGLRREEICQLYVSDIRQMDGIHYIDLNEDDERRLKTSSSIRQVPVHPFLIELGFLDLIQQRRQQEAKFLFADISESALPGKRGDGLTKAFGRHIRKIGVDDQKIVLHSFRHNFRTVLESADLEERWIDAVMGHENPRRSEGGRSYVKSLSIQRSFEVVSAFSSPVDLSFLKQ